MLKLRKRSVAGEGEQLRDKLPSGEGSVDGHESVGAQGVADQMAAGLRIVGLLVSDISAGPVGTMPSAVRKAGPRRPNCRDRGSGPDGILRNDASTSSRRGWSYRFRRVLDIAGIHPEGFTCSGQHLAPGDEPHRGGDMNAAPGSTGVSGWCRDVPPVRLPNVMGRDRSIEGSWWRSHG